MKQSAFFVILALIFSLAACQQDAIPAKGDNQVVVFDNQPLQFAPEQYPGTPDTTRDIVHLQAGRLLMKKITLPHYQRATDITAHIRLVSNGDPWDKSGSCFIIPAQAHTHFFDILLSQDSFPAQPGILEDYPGLVAQNGYLPAIELMRFMTPFGVGYFSDTLENRKPVYVDEWAPAAEWNSTITPLHQQLAGEVWVGLWVDTWTKEGYKASLTLKFDESDFACATPKPTQVLPLINTVPYIDGQNLPDVFAKGDVTVNFSLPKAAKQATLEYLVSGHGGHEGGDEFVKRENILTLNKDTIFQFIPWRNDCHAFRHLNPTSGTWTETKEAAYYDLESGKRKSEPMKQLISSSDYPRSNWCPGSHVPPRRISLGALAKGNHNLTISIPQAQAIKENEYNHWLVSARLIWQPDN